MAYGQMGNSYLIETQDENTTKMVFTFFSEFGRSLVVQSRVEVSILISLFLCAFFGNIAVLTEMFKKRSGCKFTNYFLRNLAFSDILYVLTAPLTAVTRISHSWVLGKFLCHVHMYVLFVCGAVSIWMMTVISVHRYLRIVKGKVRPMGSLVISIIGASWLTASAAFLPVAVYFHVRRLPLGNQSHVKICTMVWPSYTPVQVPLLFSFLVILVVFCLPLIIMCHNYVQIFTKFWKSRNTIRALTSDPHVSERRFFSRPSTRVNQCLQRSRNTRDLRVVRMLLLLVGLFVVMWAPVFVCMFGLQYDGAFGYMRMHSEYILTATCLSYANACINPLIYGMINKKLSAEMYKCRLCLLIPRVANDDGVYTIDS